jgi:hypothetical protein
MREPFLGQLPVRPPSSRIRALVKALAYFVGGFANKNPHQLV